MLAAGYVGYLGVPILQAGGCTASSPSTRGGRASGGRRRPKRYALAATAAAARRNAGLYQGVGHTSSNVAGDPLPTSPTGSWRSTATAASCWNPRRRARRGVRQEALGKNPTEALGRPLDAAGGAQRRLRLLPIRRGGEEVWLSLQQGAVMTDPTGAVAGRIYAFGTSPSGASNR